MTRLTRGAYMSLGTPDMGIDNVPAKLGEACWTLLADTMWTGSPWRVTKLIRLPSAGSFVSRPQGLTG